MFARNGLAISIIAALSVALFVIGFVAARDPTVLFGVHTGPGAFYKLMPHNAMVAVVRGGVSLRNGGAHHEHARVLARYIAWDANRRIASIWRAIMDAGRLRYLDGGKAGCMNDDEQPTDRRKHYHHATFYGFLLCFAATSVATLYHYLLGREAPYAWYDLPVVLGTVGGIGLVVGPIGLLIAKWRRDPALVDQARFGMDVAFIMMLLLTSVSGLLLLVLRATPAMGVLLAVHLGFVFALFLTFPYGKFVHGLYRFLALVQYARESASDAQTHEG